MPSFPLIALKRFRYNQRTIATGHRFEACSRRDAMLLKAIGNAKDPPRPSTKRSSKSSAVPETVSEPIAEPLSDLSEVPESEPVVDTPSDDRVDHPMDAVRTDDSNEAHTEQKRTYRRRDLTAESSE